MLKDERQRLVMTAHYICMADWKHISAVFGHQDRWAKDIHVKAMKVIDGLFRSDDWYAADHAADREIDILIREWKIAERRWMLTQKARRTPRVPPGKWYCGMNQKQDKSPADGRIGEGEAYV